MGWLSWLFPSEDDHVASARALLDRGKPAEARMEVLDIQRDDAQALVREAEVQLAEKNLEAALSWAAAGDPERVGVHMEMAEQFNHGQLDERFHEVRRQLREVRKARREAEAQRQAEEQARLMHVDIRHRSEGPELALPDAVAQGPEAEAIRSRLALLVGNYPEALQARIPELGGRFARAVLDLDDGRPDLALQALLALPDNEPLVQWERARAAYALGDAAAASRALRAFATHAGRHYDMGRQHSGEFLAQCMAESGDTAAALRVLRSVRVDEPNVGGVLYAQLLEASGALKEAEAVLLPLLKAHPKTTALYTLLARVRVAAGLRTQAMSVLEASFNAVCCTPGKCGSQAPDPAVYRALAMLYLEDGVETERALELAGEAAGMVQQPGWEDVYLASLVAKEQGRPEAATMAQKLWEMTPEDHPGYARMSQYLPT